MSLVHQSLPSNFESQLVRFEVQRSLQSSNVHGALMPFAKLIVQIDSDDSFLAEFSRQLRPAGYQILSFSDAEAAWLAIEEHRPRVVVMEFNSSRYDGPSLLKRIKGFDPDLHLFVLTGCLETESLVEATRLGADEYFFKPLEDWQRLEQKLQRVFSGDPKWWRKVHTWLENYGRIHQNSMAVSHSSGIVYWTTY